MDRSQTRERQLWQRIETVHAVTYFAPESIAAAKAAGLRGFWMGYFGFRAAPLGAASPGLVEATFANFASRMVHKAIPDAWGYATPTMLIEARAVSAAASLRSITPLIDGLAREQVAVLDELVSGSSPLGRPMFGANRMLHVGFEDPVARFWQLCTAYREHRGDGHLQALSSVGIDGAEAHLLLAADQGIPHDVLQNNRGWTDDQWRRARDRLRERGLLNGSSLTPAGQELRHYIESETDRLALPADPSRIDALTDIATEISSSGVIPFPNPMGLGAV